MTGIAVVFMIAVAMPIAIAFARALTARSRRAAQAADPRLLDRLDRMEEGIDAIAIEVERISEGQRFVTKVLGEGDPQRAAIPRGESVGGEVRR
jgi:hypothetical protein